MKQHCLQINNGQSQDISGHLLPSGRGTQSLAVRQHYLEAVHEGSPQSCCSLKLQSLEKTMKVGFVPTKCLPERPYCIPWEAEGRAGVGPDWGEVIAVLILPLQSPGTSRHSNEEANYCGYFLWKSCPQLYEDINPIPSHHFLYHLGTVKSTVQLFSVSKLSFQV